MQRSRALCSAAGGANAEALPAEDVAPSDSVMLVHRSEAAPVQPQIAVCRANFLACPRVTARAELLN